MPLLLQKNSDPHTRIGLWKIEEDELFFLQKVQLQQTIHHPHKRLQHLAGRYLLSLLFPHFPYDELKLDEAGKPYLSSGEYQFSISHCGDFAAVIISTQNQCGIDIELYSAKTEKVKHKYLNNDELAQVAELQKQYGNRLADYQLYTLCWCAKEAVYKWWGNGKIDFKKNILIKDINIELQQITVRFVNQSVNTTLTLRLMLTDQLSLVWTLT